MSMLAGATASKIYFLLKIGLFGHLVQGFGFGGGDANGVPYSLLLGSLRAEAMVANLVPRASCL